MRLTHLLSERSPLDPALLIQPRPQSRHAIVIGHGRVGKVVCKLLSDNGVPFTAVDDDPSVVTVDRSTGHAVYFGDATSQTFLKACGVMGCSAVIVTINRKSIVDEIVASVRQLRPDVLVVVRARDAEHARHLYKQGVSDAVPETIEASLQLSEAALLGLGIPAGKVIASIHAERDSFRHLLQDAAKEAGINVREFPRRRRGIA